MKRGTPPAFAHTDSSQLFCSPRRLLDLLCLAVVLHRPILLFLPCDILVRIGLRGLPCITGRSLPQQQLGRPR